MSSLTGTWKLIKTSSVAADGSEMPAPYGGEGAMGLVSFSESGRMVAVLCDSRTEVPKGSAREYNSYCGAYTFDGKELVTQVDASSNAAWFDSEQVRSARFEGDTLILQPPLRPYGQQPEQRTLHWKKID
ncbi:MAG: lipocalin-like domain-containing protein [Burkholderiaceae bacterium]